MLGNSAKMTSQNSERRLRIAYLTMFDPNDRRSWSGTDYYMAQALERHCGEVFCVGPLQPFTLKVGKVIQWGVRFLTGRRYLHMQTRSLSRRMGQMAQKKMSKHTYDLAFAPAGSVVLAHLSMPMPIVYLSDTTLRLMIDYYPGFSNVLSSHIRMADELERRAIERAGQLIYPSSWAARSAIQDYGADPSKVSVIPFGANLDSAPPREMALRPLKKDRCRLLCIGVNWYRKGCDIALETLLELERLGVAAELTVVGCRPPHPVSHPHFHVFPFLDKNNPREREQLDRLYSESSFFILPTRAECFGIVACEANAYGLPILSTKTGGIPEVVREGINGFLWPVEARGDQYAARIRDIYQGSALYSALRVSSRNEFESRLNWDVWGKRAGEVLLRAAGLGATGQVA